MGLYPKKAANNALEAGMLWNALATCAGAPVLVTAVTSAPGKVVFRDSMIMAKNSAWLMVCPQLFKVVRMPDAAPRCSAGTEFIIDAVFGDMKMPLPMPMTSSINAKGK
jgi:hypothetical protein